ncbi:hypothetical protein [Tolypothrix sp. NIES-4075]|uniref:hypothetical protein n=1 Tax=Tolypothrix sp. NIES-4075 TaxID=2005459 RepID=UPI000B5C7405|nr:hypothetical protein [Tolypothrix sp. NIES-4075]
MAQTPVVSLFKFHLICEPTLEELQGNIIRIEYTLDNRIDKLEQTQKAAQQPVGMEARCKVGKVEVEAMQLEKEQLLAQIEELQRENVSIVQRNQELQSENESLLQQNQELQQELINISQLLYIPV